MAQEYFEEWLPAAEGMLKTAHFSVDQGRLKDAAFLLHQATERYYHCVTLVCTFYAHHVHNLGFLRTQAERIDPRLIEAWPRETKADRARFEKLKDAYIKARYSRHYRVTEDELAWLGERVEALGKVVETVCLERIEELERSARAA
jgi:HEPN domain-containing protein